VVPQVGAVHQTAQRVVHGHRDGVVRRSHHLASPRVEQPHRQRAAPADAAWLLRHVAQRVVERKPRGAARSISVGKGQQQIGPHQTLHRHRDRQVGRRSDLGRVGDVHDPLGKVECVAARHRPLGALEHAPLDLDRVVVVPRAPLGLVLAHLVELRTLRVGELLATEQVVAAQARGHARLPRLASPQLKDEDVVPVRVRRQDPVARRREVQIDADVGAECTAQLLHERAQSRRAVIFI